MAATTEPQLSTSPDQADPVAVPEDDKTVFEDPVNFNMKHPLESRWTLWFDNPQKRANQSNWGDRLKSLVTFDTVEDFWGVYNNVLKASQLPHGANYHLFKEGIQPMWEDPQNAQGGKWVLQIKKKSDSLDQLWLNTILACIGETFPDGEEICGVVISIRKAADRISLWTRSALDETKARAAGQHWKGAVMIEDKMGYQAHSDALQKNSSFSNADMYNV
ncbi:hypothetical protein HDU85_003419 [Gaertneriomyces sp. JEL0708]|nr:hypothetical protein HDU85_003419 [Gaertneriomyces sp. JEL0708]